MPAESPGLAWVASRPLPYLGCPPHCSWARVWRNIDCPTPCHPLAGHTRAVVPPMASLGSCSLFLNTQFSYALPLEGLPIPSSRLSHTPLGPIALCPCSKYKSSLLALWICLCFPIPVPNSCLEFPEAGNPVGDHLYAQCPTLRKCLVSEWRNERSLASVVEKAKGKDSKYSKEQSWRHQEQRGHVGHPASTQSTIKNTKLNETQAHGAGGIRAGFLTEGQNWDWCVLPFGQLWLAHHPHWGGSTGPDNSSGGSPASDSRECRLREGTVARGATPGSSVHRPVYHQIPGKGRGRSQSDQTEVRSLPRAQHQAESVLRRYALITVAVSPTRVLDWSSFKGRAWVGSCEPHAEEAQQVPHQGHGSTQVGFMCQMLRWVGDSQRWTKTEKR